MTSYLCRYDVIAPGIDEEDEDVGIRCGVNSSSRSSKDRLSSSSHILIKMQLSPIELKLSANTAPVHYYTQYNCLGVPLLGLYRACASLVLNLVLE